MSTSRRLRIPLIAALLAVAAGATSRAEDPCRGERVTWYPVHASLARDGMLAVRLEDKAMPIGHILRRSEAYLYEVQGRHRVALERVPELEDPDSPATFHAFRPTRLLRPRTRYRFGSRDPRVRRLHRIFTARAETAPRMRSRPARFWVTRGGGANVRFEGRTDARVALVQVDVEAAVDYQEDGEDQDVGDWEPLRTVTVAPERLRDDRLRVEIGPGSCEGEVRWPEANLCRARFSLVAEDGYIGRRSSWVMFSPPSSL